MATGKVKSYLTLTCGGNKHIYISENKICVAPWMISVPCIWNEWNKE